MNKVHAFIVLLFRPLKINNTGKDFFKDFSLGESLPQFMTKQSGQSKKWLFTCVICEEFREFCTSKSLKYNHKFIKNLTFEGIQQMRGHQKSQAHQEACFWTEYQAEIQNTKHTPLPGRKKSTMQEKQPKLTQYFKGNHLNC